MLSSQQGQVTMALTTDSVHVERRMAKVIRYIVADYSRLFHKRYHQSLRRYAGMIYTTR